MRTLGNDELRKRIEEIGTDELAPGQRDGGRGAARRPRHAFPGETGGLEMIVRETIEALAYGEVERTAAARLPAAATARRKSVNRHTGGTDS